MFLFSQDFDSSIIIFLAVLYQSVLQLLSYQSRSL